MSFCILLNGKLHPEFFSKTFSLFSSMQHLVDQETQRKCEGCCVMKKTALITACITSEKELAPQNRQELRGRTGRKLEA